MSDIFKHLIQEVRNNPDVIGSVGTVLTKLAELMRERANTPRDVQALAAEVDANRVGLAHAVALYQGTSVRQAPVAGSGNELLIGPLRTVPPVTEEPGNSIIDGDRKIPLGPLVEPELPKGFLGAEEAQPAPPDEVAAMPPHEVPAKPIGLNGDEPLPERVIRELADGPDTE